MAKQSVSTVSAPSLGGSGVDTVNTKVLHIVNNSATFSMTVKARHILNVGVLGAPAATPLTPVAIPYRRRYLNGAVSDDDVGTAAITDTSIIEIQCEGLEVITDFTAITGGSVDIYWRDVLG